MNQSTGTGDSLEVAAALAAARAHLAGRRLAEAERACDQALRAGGPEPAAQHLLALVLAQSGRLEQGAALLAEVVTARPDAVAARNDLGAMLIALGRPEAAEPHLRAAVDLQPGNAESLVNLGNARHAQGKFEGAEAAYREALAVQPGHVRALVSLGNLLVQLRRPAEAVHCLVPAAAVAPEDAGVQMFLGNALRDLGRMDEALAGYQRALALDPGHPEVNESAACLYKARGQLEEALRHFRLSGTPFARAQALDCELRLGRSGDCLAWLAAQGAGEAANLHSASLSAYAAWHLGRPDPHPFCPEPLSRVRIVDRYTSPADAAFLRELTAEAGRIEAVWEPKGITTRLGFQTGGNLFVHAAGNPGGAIARLERDLLAELAHYRASLPAAGLGIVERWPADARLHGWFVRLVTGGHQAFHNHPFGWVSGCLYLQMPEQSPAGEGAIEFSLEGDGFPRLSDRPSPTLRHRPRPGQLALFPSSLFHRTIPFRSAEERLCIAFDLKPA
jgi:tetratricopeptide (TPR) repeat protein